MMEGGQEGEGNKKQLASVMCPHQLLTKNRITMNCQHLCTNQSVSSFTNRRLSSESCIKWLSGEMTDPGSAWRKLWGTAWRKEAKECRVSSEQQREFKANTSRNNHQVFSKTPHEEVDPSHRENCVTQEISGSSNQDQDGKHRNRESPTWVHLTQCRGSESRWNSLLPEFQIRDLSQDAVHLWFHL